MKPWEIADLLLFRFRGGQTVSAEQATDEQFEAWRKHNGIPAKPGAWSFERRCKAINQCRFYGHWEALKFPLDFSAPALNSADSALKSSDAAPNSADSSVGGEAVAHDCARGGKLRRGEGEQKG